MTRGRVGRRLHRGGLDRGRRGPATLGFTLVELLVAMAVASLVLTLLAVAIVGGARGAGRLTDATERSQRRALAWALLRQEVELAGRGLGDGSEGDRSMDVEESGHHGLADVGLVLDLDPAGDGGDRVGVRYLAEAHRRDPVVVEAWFFAAADGSGRPNLVRRPTGGVRQPWLLGVDGIHVVGGRAPDGGALRRSMLVAGVRPVALEIEVRFEDGGAVRGWAATTRSGPLGTPASLGDATGAGAGPIAPAEADR